MQRTHDVPRPDPALVRFVALAYGITWILVSPLVLSAWGLLPPLPSWLHGLGALGPVLAAWLSPRDRGLFASRGPGRLLTPATVLCLTSPLILAAPALAVAVARGEPVLAPLGRAAADGGWWLGMAVGALCYGFGEEPGWRGWLQPRLQARHSLLGAALRLAPIWALWHLPFFVYRYDFQGPGTVVAFCLGLLAGAVWLAFLYDETGSVLVVAGWHALWNVANLGLATVSGTAVAVLNALMMVLGFGVAVALALRSRGSGDPPHRSGTPS